MKPGNLSDPPAESGLETNAPSSPGIAASPLQAQPSWNWAKPSSAYLSPPQEILSPLHQLRDKFRSRNNFFFSLFKAFFFFFSARVSPLTHPKQLMVASFGGLLCVSLQSRDAEPGLVGAGGWPAQSLTLARPRGRGRPRGEWQREEGAD